MEIKIGQPTIRKNLCRLFLDVFCAAEGNSHHTHSADLPVFGVSAAGFFGEPFADPGHACIGGEIPLPKSAERERTLCHFIGTDVFFPLKRYLFPKLPFHSQTLKGQSIKRNLPVLTGHSACGRICKIILCILVGSVTDFHLPSGKLWVFCKSYHDTPSAFFHIRMTCNPLNLFICHVLTGCMGGCAGLVQGHLRHGLSHTLG